MFKTIKEITFEITNRCDLQCKICNIWKENKKVNLPIGAIKKIMESLKKPVSVSLTGGEPLLHPQINVIYKYFFKLFVRKRIKSLNIATNAYSNNILRFLENNRKYLHPLSFSISIDGLAKKHNKQRGKNDAFEKTIKNIFLIKKHNIPVSIKFVITKINYDDLFEVYKLSKKFKCIFYPKLFEKVKHYYHRNKKYPNLMLTVKMLSFVDKYMGLIYNLENKNNKNSLTAFSILCIQKLIKNKSLNFIKKCLIPKYSLFITCYGDIYNCIYKEKIGNFRNCLNLNLKKYKEISNNAKNGKCPKCLSYHGYLRAFNNNFYKV